MYVKRIYCQKNRQKCKNNCVYLRIGKFKIGKKEPKLKDSYLLPNCVLCVFRFLCELFETPQLNGKKTAIVDDGNRCRKKSTFSSQNVAYLFQNEANDTTYS